VTFPKLRVPGATANWPGLAPVPASDTLRAGTDPSAVRERLPLAFPLVEGVNITLKVRLCPAFSVVGTFSPFVVNPVPVRVIFEIFTLEPPEFVKVSERV